MLDRHDEVIEGFFGHACHFSLLAIELVFCLVWSPYFLLALMWLGYLGRH